MPLLRQAKEDDGDHAAPKQTAEDDAEDGFARLAERNRASLDWLRLGCLPACTCTFACSCGCA